MPTFCRPTGSPDDDAAVAEAAAAIAAAAVAAVVAANAASASGDAAGGAAAAPAGDVAPPPPLLPLPAAVELSQDDIDLWARDTAIALQSSSASARLAAAQSVCSRVSPHRAAGCAASRALVAAGAHRGLAAALASNATSALDNDGSGGEGAATPAQRARAGAAAALSALATALPDAGAAALAAGAAAPLLQMLSGSLFTPLIEREAAAAALWTLARTETDLPALVSAGAAGALLGALVSNTDPAAVSACHVLGILAAADTRPNHAGVRPAAGSGKLALASENAGVVLCRLLEEAVPGPATPHAASALSKMSAGSRADVRAYVTSAVLGSGCLAALAAAATAAPPATPPASAADADADAAAAAAAAEAEAASDRRGFAAAALGWLCGIDAAIATSLRDSGAVARLVAALWDPRLAPSAVLVFWKAARSGSDGEVGKALARDSGAIRPIVQLLRDRKAAPKAASALWEIAQDSPRNAEAVREAGGIPLLLAVVRGGAGGPGNIDKAARAAIGVLMTLSTNDSLRLALAEARVDDVVAALLAGIEQQSGGGGGGGREMGREHLCGLLTLACVYADSGGGDGDSGGGSDDAAARRVSALLAQHSVASHLLRMLSGVLLGRPEYLSAAWSDNEVLCYARALTVNDATRRRLVEQGLVPLLLAALAPGRPSGPLGGARGARDALGALLNVALDEASVPALRVAVSASPKEIMAAAGAAASSPFSLSEGSREEHGEQDDEHEHEHDHGHAHGLSVAKCVRPFADSPDDKAADCARGVLLHLGEEGSGGGEGGGGGEGEEGGARPQPPVGRAAAAAAQTRFNVFLSHKVLSFPLLFLACPNKARRLSPFVPRRGYHPQLTSCGVSRGGPRSLLLFAQRTDAKDFARGLYNMLLLRGFSTFLARPFFPSLPADSLAAPPARSFAARAHGCLSASAQN